MAKLYFKVGSDVDRVIQLRQEISKLKQELMSMDVNKAPAAAKALQTQIGAATQEFTKLTTEAAKAGAIMESDFKTKIYQSSQSVNDLTQKITNQKVVIKDVEADVRKLSDAYRSVRNNPLQSSNALGELNAARKALQEEKSVLFGLQTEQSNARLSVKKLRDEYALYKDETKSVVDANGGMSISFKKVLASIGGVYAVKELLGQITSVTGMFQKYESVLTNALNGDSALAKRYMSDIATFAAETNFQLDDLTDNFIKLVNRGVTPTIDTFGKLGDFANVTAKPMGQLNEAILDINNPERWKEFGVQVSTEGKKVSLTFRGMKIEAERSVESVMKAIEQFASMDGVAGTTKSIAGTIEGQMSNFQDTVTTALNEIGQHNKDFIAGSIEAASVVVQNYDKIGKATMALVATYGAYRAAVALAAATSKGYTIAQVAQYNILLLSEKAQKALNLAVLKNPYVIAAVAIVGVASAMWAFHDSTTAAEKAQKRFNETSSNQKKQLDDLKNGVDGLISVIKSETSTQYDKIKSYKELQKLMPAVFSNMDIETLKLMDILSLNKQIAEEVNRRERVGAKTNAVLRQNELNDINARIDKMKNTPGRGEYLMRLEEEKKVAEESVKIANKAVEDIVKIQNEANKPKSEKSKIQNKEYWEDQKKSAEKALADIDSKQKKLLDSGKFDGIDAKVVQNYKSQSKMLKEAQEELKVYDMPGKNNKEESAAEKLRKQNDKVSGIEEKNARERIRRTEDIWNQLWQGYIDLMDEGGDKTLAQMELNHEKELQAIDREKEDLIEKYKEVAKAEFDAKENVKKIENPQYKMKSFNGSGISLSSIDTTQLDEKYKVALDRQSKAVKAYYELEKQALNEYLIEYGTYQQKRQAIIDNGEVKKKGKNDWEKKSIDQETKKLLAGIDDEAQRKTSIITKLFSDMSMRTVADIRLIANEAKNMLDYVNGGEFKTDSNGIGLFGITKEQFDILSKSPEKLESIKNEIANVNREADAAETALGKMATGLKKVFSSNPVKFKEGLSNLSDGMNQLTQSGKFLSESLSSLGDSLGSGALNEIASGVDVAMDAMSSTMDGAKAGAAFGPWGAPAGAAIGMVTSLASSFAKIHDAKNEKRIQVLQGQIEVLEKTYDTLGESIEKAYSKDASRLIAQQNTLLEQQKVLIRNQIAEEEQKKKSDSGRIEDWKKQIEDINKLIGENKVKLVDAIFGEDIKSAIDNFAQSYADTWTSNENRAKSAKDTVKDMMRQMVTESIKAAIQSSKSMEQIRTKLQEFYADNVLSGWEQNYIYNMAEELQKELDKQFGWADSLMKDDKSSQDSTKGTFQAMSQDTGDELNGRFTALQISNEEIKNQGILQAQSLEILSAKTDAILFVSTETRDIADETRTILANSYIELLQISENTGESAKHLKDIKSDIAEVKRNTGRI
ncbi:hypothetical protein [Bacteroides neonati]|uniref:hypothetical protein n=1 Tax=Bacteroides neonati TaxID=1347393 RepID=UPI0004B6DDFE|nr:hypothetical protein [Bacteroides neonati]